MKGAIFSDQLIVAIDVGTTKMCVLIAQPLGEHSIEIIGIGKAPSDGLSKGVVVDITRTIKSIRTAVKEAELMAGCKIESATIGIAGAHIRSLNSHGMVAIRKNEIRETDIGQVLNSARAIIVSEGHQILHVLPQFFIIDGQEKILDPIGMYGVRLEAQVHIITGSIASVQNLVKCCEMAGVQVTDIVLEQLASAEAVLSFDERQLGVAILDIGGGTSDLAIYHNGSIRHTMVLPVAGNHFTNDLAIGLPTTLAEAERIKKENGHCYAPTMPEDGCIEIQQVGGKAKQVILQSEIVSILQPRAEEILRLVHHEIMSQGMRPFIPTGFVLTGGGSLLRGMTDLATTIFDVPVRIGNPQLESGFAQSLDNPMYATGYGLLLHTIKKQDTTMQSLTGPLWGRIFSRMKSWVSDFF